MRQGCAGVELDVLLTADGYAVVWHDPVLLADKVTCEGTDLVGARIDELTLDQLRTVDVGSRTLPAYPRQQAVPGARIPLLSEVFAAVEAGWPDAWHTVEVKCIPYDPRDVARREQLVETVISQIRDAGVGERVLVHSFDWAVLESAARLDPALRRSALATFGETFVPGSAFLGSIRYEDFAGDLPGAAAAVGADVVAPAYARVYGTSVADPGFELACDREFVTRAHGLGLAVLPWTVNAAADIRAVIGAGVDGFVTDYPDVAVALAAGAAEAIEAIEAIGAIGAPEAIEATGAVDSAQTAEPVQERGES